MLTIENNRTLDGEVFILIKGTPRTEEEKALIEKMQYTFRKCSLPKVGLILQEETSDAEY